MVNGGEEVAMVNGRKRWNFPPQLEDFDLMNSDMDPVDLEQTFEDNRWALIRPQHNSVVSYF